MAEGRDFFVELGSVTVAHKAQHLLEQRGIVSRVGKLSSPSRGCSYGLYVKGSTKEEVTLLLNASSVKIL